MILAVAALLPSLFWPHGTAAADQIRAAGFARVYVPSVAEWADKGVPVRDAKDLSEYTNVPAPQTKGRMNVAGATAIPWIDANGWRYNRGLQRAFYDQLPAGTAALAAAEAYAYGADAVLAPDQADMAALAAMMKFLASVPEKKLPVMANIGVIDDGTPLVGEVMNLLGRRNLLYRVVKTPDPKLALNVQLGTPDYPKESAANPSDFASRVREKLSDERRSLRIFGSYNVIGHLTGDRSRARLHLLNYTRRPAKEIHVRVLGAYKKVSAADSADSAMKVADVKLHQGGTEFTIPSIQTYTIIDLEE